MWAIQFKTVKICADCMVILEIFGADMTQDMTLNISPGKYENSLDKVTLCWGKHKTF